MDLDEIFRLMDRAEKSTFNKIEIQYQDLRLSLERGGGPVLTAASAPAAEVIPEKTAEPDDTEMIRSPISGVFYMAKEPGAEPFVTLGSHVSKGDTVCIIEAMKTMNEISSPFTGIVAGVLVKDGQTVTAGDALFRLAGSK
jgi:acetyl-CoA carboxylase biotin carboxyl carrier protein